MTWLVFALGVLLGVVAVIIALAVWIVTSARRVSK